MMGSAATSMSSMLEKRVNISPPTSTIVSMDQSVSGEDIADFLKGSFVKVSFNMVIGDLVDSVLMQLYPFDFARELYSEFVSVNSIELETPNQAPSEDYKEDVKPKSVPPQESHEEEAVQNGYMNHINGPGFMGQGKPLYESKWITNATDSGCECTASTVCTIFTNGDTNGTTREY